MGGSVVVVMVRCGDVMEDRYDLPTTTSSIRCWGEVLYADVSTGQRSARASQRGSPRGCRFGTPGEHPHSGRGTASSPVVVIHDHRQRRANPLLARWGQFGTPVNRTGRPARRRRGRTVVASCHHRDGAGKFPAPSSSTRTRPGGGAILAPPSPRAGGAKPLVARCGKFSATVTSGRTDRGSPNGVAKSATPLTAHRSSVDGSCKLPPPPPARTATSTARRQPRLDCRSALRVVMVVACSRVMMMDGSRQVGAHRFP